MSTNPWIKTVTLAAAAGAVVALAVATHPATKPVVAGNSDQGAALAPELTDPQKITSLEVISWDDQEARPRAFKVEQQNNKWVIPSAFNYPVDATQNMAAAAASFVGALKERVVTDQASEHQRLGVVAPDDVASTATTGRGTRVTMRDAGGKTVADLIIGGAVQDEASAAGAPPSKRYVREVGKNRVYTTTLNQAYSTKFADWVQTDLLKVVADQVKSVGVERYRINEQNGTLADLRGYTLTRPDAPPPGTQQPAAPPPWTLVGSENGGPDAPPPAGSSLNQQRIDDMLTTLATLKIVGVRTKPANLAQVLSGENKDHKVTLTTADQLSLQRHGFFITSNGIFVANEGSMAVHSTDGVVYSLWIGELATDEYTKDQAAGSSPSPSADAKNKSPEGRYMMVTVSFDEKALGPPLGKPAELEDLEKQAAAATPDKPLSDDAKARLTNLGVQYKAMSEGYTKRVQAGKDRQASLAKRFAGWYYVVDAASLSKLRPTREELLSAQPPAPPATPTTPPTVIPTMQGQ